MLAPLEQFVCDHCGRVIQSKDQGWLEWLHEEQPDGRRLRFGFRIVHQPPYSPHSREAGFCYHYAHRPNVGDEALDNFHMAYLLSFLDVGPHFDCEYMGPTVVDLREYVEILRRLTVPYYEEARLYLPQAEADGFLDGANPNHIYSVGTMRNVVERYGQPG